MSVQLANELWNLVRDGINDDVMTELAESFVAILLDHGYDLDDIKYEFDDENILDAIKFYADEEVEEESEDEEYGDGQESDW